MLMHCIFIVSRSSETKSKTECLNTMTYCLIMKKVAYVNY